MAGTEKRREKMVEERQGANKVVVGEQRRERLLEQQDRVTERKKMLAPHQRSHNTPPNTYPRMASQAVSSPSTVSCSSCNCALRPSSVPVLETGPYTSDPNPTRCVEKCTYHRCEFLVVVVVVVEERERAHTHTHTYIYIYILKNLEAYLPSLSKTLYKTSIQTREDLHHTVKVAQLITVPSRIDEVGHDTQPNFRVGCAHDFTCHPATNFVEAVHHLGDTRYAARVLGEFLIEVLRDSNALKVLKVYQGQLPGQLQGMDATEN
jgi:hypothetical protein